MKYKVLPGWALALVWTESTRARDSLRKSTPGPGNALSAPDVEIPMGE